jgi:transcriptional regulator with XRE-family HTH domain
MSRRTACIKAELATTKGPDFIGASAVLTGSQIRAARALLKWSAQELATRSGVSYGAIQKAENIDGLPAMQVRNLAAIKEAFESAGLVFIDGDYSGRGGPGVRLK